MDNSFEYTCLVFNTFVNINILYVIMQLILLSGDLCCKFAHARPFHKGSTQSFSGLWSYN